MTNKQQILDKLNFNREKTLSKVGSLELEHLGTMKLAKKDSVFFFEKLSLYKVIDEDIYYCVKFNKTPPLNSLITQEKSLYGKFHSQRVDSELAKVLLTGFKSYDYLRDTLDILQPYSFLVAFCFAQGYNIVEMDIVD